MRVGVSVIACALLAALVLAACGHGHDNDPYVIESEEEAWSGPRDGFEIEIITPSQQAKTAVEEMAWDFMSGGAAVIRAMDFVAMVFDAVRPVATDTIAVDDHDEGDALRTKRVTIERAQEAGGSVRAQGSVMLVRNGYHCAIFAEMDVAYDAFKVASRATVSGDGAVRLILSSYGCRFFQNIHADIRLAGSFAVGEQLVNNIDAKIDYESSKGRKSDFEILSATVAASDRTFHCQDRNGRTMCTTTATVEKPNFCAADEDVCELTWEGHQGCMRPGLEGIGAHCNLGCCDEGQARTNTCNHREIEGRECSPELEPMFTASYMVWGTNLQTYEVPIRCSEDGIWTPPCSAEVKSCPRGSRCSFPAASDWANPLKHYGHCSCLMGR